MGSIEGVIILSSTNEPILTSHFVHPLSNYASLHADQLVAKLEEAAHVTPAKTLSPVLFTEGIPSLPQRSNDHEEESNTSGDSSSEDDGGQDGGDHVEKEDTIIANPLSTGAALVHVEHNRLRFIATFSHQVDPLLPLSFLQALVANLELYLGSPLTEEAIRDNFDIVYQMLEEMLDESGHPLNTEYNTLRELVREPSWLDSIVNKLGSTMSNISNAALGNAMSHPHISPIAWRRPVSQSQRSGARNEIYIDSIEQMTGIYGRGPAPKPIGPISLHCRLEGLSKLSGTPDLLLRLLDVKRIEDASLHPCIRVRTWKQDRTLSFIPPDGKFVLADFALVSTPALERHIPIALTCLRQDRAASQEQPHLTTFEITLRATQTVEEVEITFGLGDRSASIDSSVTGGTFAESGMNGEDLNTIKGSFHFDVKTGRARWTLARITPQQRPLTLKGTIRSEAGAGVSSAVTARFAVPNATSLSGVKVSSLEVVNEVGYKPFKGVKSFLTGKLDWRW